ncbi:PstS family phosphate ABC transporter substrate-binding protein [Mucilaginibacter calamicampi]|uniref:PstS family phosphate ABC transporter substrate-binding protein n=1 Tax=Mucilaginibacter calamicampi TaxID=1302352 RepID=A0ABW2Z4L2_9SPHI
MKFKAKYLFVALLAITACGEKKSEGKQKETTISGTTLIAVDESCQPIVDEEAFIFKSLNEGANLNIVYGSENRAVRMLLNDSVRLAILSRKLSTQEERILINRNLAPLVDRFAVDAVALIVNNASVDTLITVSELKSMLNGKTKTELNIVFDNPNSSLVRYLKAFSGSADLKGRNIYALKDNKEVIKYVSQHTNAIGITGFSWLNDPDDDFADAVKKVKLVGVKDDSNKTEYFKPSQSTLALKQYPLTRDLYIVNSTGKQGLGSGFAYFLLGEKGQRILLQSGILPDSIPTREVNIIKKNK